MNIRSGLFGVFVGALVLCLAGCDDSLESQRASLDKFVAKSRIGSSSDVWLTKFNALGDWERVALIFGFMDDREFCEDIAQLYMKKYPVDRYRCDRAN